MIFVWQKDTLPPRSKLNNRRLQLGVEVNGTMPFLCFIMSFTHQQRPYCLYPPLLLPLKLALLPPFPSTFFFRNAFLIPFTFVTSSHLLMSRLHPHPGKDEISVSRTFVVSSVNFLMSPLPSPNYHHHGKDIPQHPRVYFHSRTSITPHCPSVSSRPNPLAFAQVMANGTSAECRQKFNVLRAMASGSMVGAEQRARRWPFCSFGKWDMGDKIKPGHQSTWFQRKLDDNQGS